MAEKTINVDIVDKSVAPLNHINIAIVNEPNPVKGLDVTGKQLLQLIRIQNYWITNTADGKHVTGDNIFDYFPELNPWGGGGSGGPTSADKVSYDNSSSGLTGDDVQEAIDELAEGGGGGSGVGKATTEGGEIFNDYTNNVAWESSHAEGVRTKAYGPAAHAEGANTTAGYAWESEEGLPPPDSGECAHAEGDSTIASGNSSHAEGYITTASGISSHAEGLGSNASGDYSHAEGYHTIAGSMAQHAQGKYNVADSTGKYAFIIGNGRSEDNRSNAIAIDWDGKIYVNNSSTGIDVSKMGDVTALTTTDKSSVVAAINELASEVLGIDALVGTGVIS